MTAWADERRGRMAVRIGYGAALAAVLALAATVNGANGGAGERKLSGSVVPGWSETAARAARVSVTTSNGGFEVVRDDDGWRLPTRDGHPAAPGAFAALDRTLAGLTFIERKTADPDKFDRLGLGDPASGGGGARLVVETAEGERLVGLVFGDPRPGGGVYARQVDGGATFALEGERPRIDSPTDWIDLDFLAIDRAAIARARITPASGPAYVLARETEEQRDFAFADGAAGWKPLTVGAGNGVAAALALLKFEDVKAEPKALGAPVGVHEAQTFDGLSIRLDVLILPAASVAAPGAEPDPERWARITATAPEETASLSAQAYAAALNTRTKGWVYRLPPYAPDRLTRPLADLATPPGK